MKTIFPNHALRWGIYIVLATLLVTNIVLYTVVTRTQREQDATQKCLQNYITTNYDVQRQRAAYFEQERQSLANVFNVVATTTDREKMREAIAAHNALLQKNDAQRKAHPVPDPPRNC